VTSVQGWPRRPMPCYDSGMARTRSSDRGIPLPDLLAVLNELAPLALAEEWDSVGLLIEPEGPERVQRVLLAIDLSAPVLEEALRRKAELIVAYHPPIFGHLTALRRSVPKERVLLRAVAAGIYVYAPQPALDAVVGGVNDWLADGLGAAERAPLLPAAPVEADESAKAGAPRDGQGRLVRLPRAVSLETVVGRVKRHLGLKHLRVARAAAGANQVHTLAVCAGAGGSVLRGVEADVYLTGEMKHHDVMAALGGGTSVILCEHTNTERGYLPTLRRNLRKRLSDLEVIVSRADREPLKTS